MSLDEEGGPPDESPAQAMSLVSQLPGLRSGDAPSAAAEPLPRPATDLKFAVLQLGARMHYALPAIFQRAGMLRAFYTDAVSDVGVLDTVNRLLPNAVRSKPMRRLFGRRLPENVPHAAVVSAPGRSIVHAALGRVPGGRSLAPLASPSSWLHRKILAEDFRGANALYCLDNSDLEVMREARRKRMFIVYEQICCPEVGRIMRQERTEFPGLEEQDPEELVEGGIKRDLEAWNLSNIVIAPSTFVRDSMVRLGFPAERIRVVPYGLSEDWFETPAQPKPGRVLFVGNVCLLKGNHYLAEARRLLLQRGLTPEFRVVGPLRPYVPHTSLFEGPDYVGQVPRTQVREEFAQADVFAFPTISESFGLVHLEALACGVPVVTTPNCGSVVRHGVDGYIVPIRAPEALADRLQQLLENRPLRDRMSASARQRARQFSWRQYAENLLGAVVTNASSDVKRAS